MDSLKPTLILEDDIRSFARWSAHCIRRFAGTPVLHDRSIEAFLRRHNLEIGDKKGLAEALRDYTAISLDNNYEAQDHGNPNDGYIRGIDFLRYNIGPALKLIDEKERPMLVCFAPSSGELISMSEKSLWENYNIVSFHKFYETPLVGLCLRIRRETGILLSRRALIEGVLNFQITEEFESPLKKFTLSLQFKTEEHFRGEPMDKVEGKGNPLPWEKLLDLVSKESGIKTEELLERINNEGDKLRQQTPEGNGPSKERRS